MHTDSKQKDTTQLQEGPSLFLKGFLMGSADVVPGVSGGTMALILGIYHRLLRAIKSVNSDVIRSLFTFRISQVFSSIHWKFLLFLLSGILSAVLFFTKIIKLPELMFTDPEPVYGIYFGLILGSIFLLIKDLREITWVSLSGLLIGTFIGYTIVNLVPTDTPESSWFIFLSGMIAITAMILPGISGSFLLLILGKYTFILSQIGKIGGPETTSALLILGFFAIGMVVGIGVFSRILSWLLERYYVFTMTILIGFLIGSLSIIWPFQERDYARTERIKTVSFQDPTVQLAQSQVSDTTQLPEFYRVISTYPTDLPMSERQVQIGKVKKKLIHSSPFLPNQTDTRLSDGASSFWWGWGGMVIGLMLVLLIAKIADRKEPSV